MPVGLFFQLLMQLVRLTRLAPRVARILGIRVSGRADRDIRSGSYILYGVGIALAVAYFVYYLLGLQVDQSGRLLHEGAAVGVAEIFAANSSLSRWCCWLPSTWCPTAGSGCLPRSLRWRWWLSLACAPGHWRVLIRLLICRTPDGRQQAIRQGSAAMAIATYWPALPRR